MRTATFIAAALLAVAAQAADDGTFAGTVIRDTPLQQGPASQAQVIAQLHAQTPVRILARQGAWLQVKWTQGKGDSAPASMNGWVRLLAVRTAPGSAAGDSGVTQAFNLSRTGATGSAVATGVRGLSKGDVQNAVPNFAEAAKLDGYAATAADAQAFAQSAPSLRARNVPYVNSRGGAP
jgi:hypothetical protein